MSRALTRREKALMGVLAVLLVGLVYYLLVYQPAIQEVASIKLENQEIEDSILVEESKALRLEQMRKELETLQQTGDSEIMPTARFDNVQNVMTQLNAILTATTDYELNFSPLVQDDNLVRRSIGMSFTCNSYGDARDILYALYSCQYRCRISDFSLDTQSAAATTVGENDLALDNVQVSLTAIFYECIDVSQ